MNKQPTRRSSLFLMELIIAILFFSLASTVCVRIFVKSHTLEQESIRLNHAVSAASSVAEIFRNQENPFEILEKQYPDGIKNDDYYRFFYDKDWSLCNKNEAIYTVIADFSEDGSFETADIQVATSEECIYDLSIKKYVDQEGN